MVGHKGYDGGHNCARIFLVTIESKRLWSSLCQNIFGDNCALRAKATTVRGPRVRKGSSSNRWVALPDGGGSLEDVEVLQDVWNCHQTQSSQEPKSFIEKLSLKYFSLLRSVFKHDKNQESNILTFLIITFI